MRGEEKKLHGQVEKCLAEQKAAQEAVHRALNYIDEGGQKISNED